VREQGVEHELEGGDTAVTAVVGDLLPTRASHRTDRAPTALSSEFPTSPILGLDLPVSSDTEAPSRADQARAHEAAAEVLADRGDWRRAYHHLRAAMALVHVERSQPVRVPDQLQNEVVRLRRERAEAREQSRRDSLTATWNRRYLDEQLVALAAGGAGRSTICVALADIDHFKQVNDTHGHAVGDRVLRLLVSLMSQGLPDDAFCARYGGEEFALVLPGVAQDEAVRLCEAARARVEQHSWDEVAPGLRITVSIGVSALASRRRLGSGPSGYVADISRPDDGAVLGATDALLYVAKRAGRNAVAHRDAASGRVRLAGAASARRGLEAAARALFPSA